MKNIKFKKTISITLISSLLIFSSMSSYAEKSNEIDMSSDDSSQGDLLYLYAYYDTESCKVYSEMCVFSDEKLPEIYCSYDNENFVLTEASEENKFSFTPDSSFEEVYVKAVQSFDDGTVYVSDVKAVDISENASLASVCSDDDDLGYIPDSHLGEAITVVPRSFAYMFSLYPNGSYFSETGVACTCHSYCNWQDPGDCTLYEGAIQCLGFAKMVYHEAHDSSLGTLTSYNATLTSTKAQSLFKGSSSSEILCTYLRVRTVEEVSENYDGRYDHSIIIVLADNSRVVVYHANYDGPCLVRYQSYTWANFVQAFPYLYSYCK